MIYQTQVVRPMMKRILAYGDSNTWGFLPVDMVNPQIERLAFEARWTGVAQAQLGADYLVLEDALPGRTLALDRPDMAGTRSLDPATWNGLKELMPTLIRNVPLDLVVIALGTNDLLMDPDVGAETYLERLSSLVRRIKSFELPLPLIGMDAPPSVLVMAPPGIGTRDSPRELRHAEAKRAALWPLVNQHAKSHSYHVVDGAKAVPTLGGDGVHLDRQAHLQLGALMAEAIAAIDGGPER
jgi:lysophospholipase L1-like esterase